MSIKDFIWEVKTFGLRIATDNLFISLLKSWLNAKRIQITYKKEVVNYE